MGISHNSYFAWTDARIALLKQRQADRISVRKIAKELGCTPGAVSGKIHRLKLPKHGHAPASNTPRRRKSEQTPRRVFHVADTAHGGQRAMMVDAVDLPPMCDLPAADIPIEQRKTLIELRSNDCRWPYGDPGTPDFFFCGGPKEEGSYCAMHASIAFNPKRYRRAFDP